MAIIEAVFANKAGQTPQEVERRRRMAQALVEAGAGGKPPSSGLELAGRLAMTLTGQYQAGKAERQDAANRASASTLLANTLLGTPGQTGGSMPSVSPSGQIPAKPTAGKEWDTVAPRLVSDLSKDFQLTPEQAAGVVGQLGHESAGFGTMQEVNPTVPGSRGGYGYAQWTGPRRKQFETWAGQNNLDPNSYEANYGFLKNELANSPEGAVLGDLRAAPDAMTAGRMFTDKFLRPGTPNYGSRDAWTQKALAFANQPAASTPGEVASLDQSVGIPMPGAAGQMRANAPAQPMPQQQPQMASTQQAPALPPATNVSTPPVPPNAQQPNSMAALIPPEFQNSPQLMNADPNKGIMQALLGGRPASPEQVAQAQQPQAMAGQPDRRAQIAALLQNPYTQEMGQQMLMQEYQQQQEEQKWRAREDYKLNTQRADPSYKLEQDYKQAQLEALKAKTGKRANVTNLGDGWLYDNDKGEAFRPQDEAAKTGGSGFRFGGNSVEAQSLNGLIESGQITEGQAQQLGAGKTITDPSTGSMMFLTPQGIFQQQQGQQATPMDQSQSPINLFGDGGANASAPSPTTAPSPAASGKPQNAPTQATDSISANNPGIIPLTGGKPQKLLTEAERKNQSLFSVIKPELQVVEDNYDALANTKNQVYSKLPFSEYATTPEYQKAANSLQTIVSSYLYSVSGATATPEEVRKQTDILTPRPGESKESIENKKRRVRTMVNAVAQAGSLPPMEEPQAAAHSEQPEDLSTMPVPEGMDENIWKFVPPEDRKLWLKK